MPTADTDNNIIATIYNGIATLGTDYNTSGVSSGIHIPLQKMIWGNESISRRVGNEYPMPVDIKSFNGNSGADYLLGVTGSVRGIGRFVVGNTATDPMYIVGVTNAAYAPVQIQGIIQGITNGILVGITTGPITFSNLSIGIYGLSGGTAITVTGGRHLSSSTDSVTTNTTIVGLSLSSGLLGFTNDSVRIRGSSGETYIPTLLKYLEGNTLTSVGMSGDAIKVSIVNTGITFSVNLSTTIGVTNGDQNPLKIQGGTASDNPVLIKYYNSSYVPVYTPNPIQTEILSTGGTYNDQIQNIITSLSGSTGSVTAIKNSVSLISVINDKLSPNGITVKVSEITKPNRLQNGLYKFASTSVIQLTTGSSIVLKSGINLKSPATNTSTIYVGSSIILATKDAAYPLEPGESLFIECNTTDLIYCYATIDPTTQKLIYIGS